jgi:Lipocalin-like domain
LRANVLLYCVALWSLSAQTTSAQALQSDAAKRLVGTWRLISIADSQFQEYRGDKPVGLIYYDDKGNMAVQIMPSRPRSKYAELLPSPEEARDALLGYTAYFGTYSVDEDRHIITHHRIGNINPGALGAFVRRYEFLSDDRVLLSPVESKAGLTWERVK